jgi:hypothetical protein
VSSIRAAHEHAMLTCEKMKLMIENSSIENIKALAQREWNGLVAALEMKCNDFMVKKEANQVELIAPGKKITFTFDPDPTRLGNEPCSLEVRTTRDVTQYFFRLSEDKATGHFFESQQLMNLPKHLIHGLPKTTIDKIAADACRHLSQ